MSIKLCVEHLTYDKSVGYTKNPAMMLSNAQKIHIANIENTSDITGLIFQAGRYVAAIMIDTDGKYVMSFFDLNRDRQKASQIAKKLFTDETAKTFMKNFEEVTKNYKRHYKLVELVVDSNFPPTPSAN
jgi:hypothetical protein